MGLVTNQDGAEYISANEAIQANRKASNQALAQKLIAAGETPNTSISDDDTLLAIDGDTGAEFQIPVSEIRGSDASELAGDPAFTDAFVASDTIREIVVLTQAEYGLITPLSTVMYIITDEIGTRLSAIKISDESVANNTIQDDNHLFLPLTSGKWIIEGALFCDNAAVTADIQIQWTGPSDAVGLLNIGGQTVSATSAFGSLGQSTVARAAPANRGLITGSSTLMIPLTGFVTITTAGVYKIQWAQVTTDGANPTFVRTGSTLVATRAA